ncbi:MAG: hypothetical protein OHK0023_06430 [Anaerolineae bacterium]
MRQSAEAFVFRYHTGNALLATEIGIPLILVAGLLIYPHSRLLATVLQSSAVGILVWAALQVLRYGRSIRLYPDYLLVQGSITGRVRRIPYTHLRGWTQTRRGGIAIVYSLAAPPAHPVGSTPSLIALSKVKEANTPPRQKLYISAKVSEVEALVSSLKERCSPSLPQQAVEMLVIRRRLRDVLIVLLLLLLTPIYVIVLFQIF